MTVRGPSAWTSLLETARGCFGAPSFGIFQTLLAGWVLAPGRRTITAMVAAADPEARRAHDAYHRFIRVGRWSTQGLWRSLVCVLVARFAAEGTVTLDLDDTVYKKTGHKVCGQASSETRSDLRPRRSPTPGGSTWLSSP